MIAATLVFRFDRQYGWQLFDYIPRVGPQFKPVIKVHHHEKTGKASLLNITGVFECKPIIGRFMKAPHKLIQWPSINEVKFESKS